MEVQIVNAVGGAEGDRWVVKSPGSAEEAARLEREFVLLRRAAHPSVVEVAPFEGPDLRTRYAGRPLQLFDPMTPAELCGLGAR